MKHCYLNENKLCDDCHECERCELDPEKICDNCCKCLESTEEYRAVTIDYLEDQLQEENDEDALFETDEEEGEEEGFELEPLLVDQDLLQYWENILARDESLFVKESDYELREELFDPAQYRFRDTKRNPTYAARVSRKFRKH